MQEIIYSVLIVSMHKGFTSQIIKFLEPDKFTPVDVATSIAEAKRMILEKDYDICIINSPLGDDIGTDFTIDIASLKNIGVILFSKSDYADELYDKTFEYGVLLLTKPTSGMIFRQTIRLLCASKERIGRLTNKDKKEKKTLEERLSEIKLINSAKLALIKNLNYSEEEAHRYLEKRAMDLRRPKLDIAKEIIEKYKG